MQIGGKYVMHVYMQEHIFRTIYLARAKYPRMALGDLYVQIWLQSGHP